MTHFTTIVIVPKKVFDKGRPAVEGYVRSQMEPYQESGAGCDPQYCTFKVTTQKKDFKKAAKKLIDENTADGYFKEHPEAEKKYKDLFEAKRYKDLLLEWEGGETNSDGDLGYYTNENSFYDYYGIEGRWDEKVSEEYHVTVKKVLEEYQKRETELQKAHEAKEEICKVLETGGGWNFGYATPFRKFFKGQDDKVWQEFYKEVGTTIAKELRQYDSGVFHNPFLFYKIVADGTVYEFDDIGWWGMSKPKMTEAEWKKTYLELLESHKNDVMIGLDCHV